MPQEKVPTQIDKFRKLLQEEIDTRIKGVVDASFLAEKLRVHIDDQLSQKFDTTRHNLISEIRERVDNEVARSRSDVESHYRFLKKTGTYFGLSAAALFVFLSFQEFRAIPDKISTAVTTAISGKRDEITKLQSQVEVRLQIVKEEQKKSQERSKEAQVELERLIATAKTDIAEGKREIDDKRKEVVEAANDAVPKITESLETSLADILEVSETITDNFSAEEQIALSEIKDKKNQVIKRVEEKSGSFNVVDNQIKILRDKSASATSVVEQLINSGTKFLGDAIEKGREISKVRDDISRLEGETKVQASRLVRELEGKIEYAGAELSAKLVSFEKSLESEVAKYKESLDDQVFKMRTTIGTLIVRLNQDARFKVGEEIRRETGKFREAISQQALKDALEFMKERSFRFAMEKRVLTNISKYGSDDKITILTHFKESRITTSTKRRLTPLMTSALNALDPKEFSRDQRKTFPGLRLGVGLKFDLIEINQEIDNGLAIASKETALENLFGLLEDVSGTAGKKPPILSRSIAARFAVPLSSIATQHASRKIRIRAASYLVGALRRGSVGAKWDKNAVTKWIDDFLKRDGATAEGSLVALRAIPTLPENNAVLASLVQNLKTVNDTDVQQKLAKLIFDYLRKLDRHLKQGDAAVKDVIATIRPHMFDDEKRIDEFLELRANIKVYIQSPRVKIDSTEIEQLIEGGIVDVNKSFKGTPYKILNIQIRKTRAGGVLSGKLQHASGGETEFSINIGDVEEGKLAISKQPVELGGKISLGLRMVESAEGDPEIFLYLRRL